MRCVTITVGFGGYLAVLVPTRDTNEKAGGIPPAFFPAAQSASSQVMLSRRLRTSQHFFYVRHRERIVRADIFPFVPVTGASQLQRLLDRHWFRQLAKNVEVTHGDITIPRSEL
jgi:hypothetical protein